MNYNKYDMINDSKLSYVTLYHKHYLLAQNLLGNPGLKLLRQMFFKFLGTKTNTSFKWKTHADLVKAH